MTPIIFESAPNMIATHAMISNSPALMVGFVTFSETFTRGAGRVPHARMPPPASSVTAATAMPAAVFGIGRGHD
ncbi:hypothetical protein CYL20_07285 [Pseudomonas palleroniana]|uniref:Uncharacterized protein n=1 Tax=Pseudomonas palleroniana TaxID=191390 RepID=A0A2L1J788_9PSED|nr:hypothetical protein CYL20_07285 [Pseudomonas palleroniana]